MVRILHFSDLHLGAESYGRFDPETGLSSRMGDFTAAFDHVVAYALQNDIHLVLFAGDAYKTCDPSPTLQREFAHRIAQMARAGIPVVLLVGNHDVPNARGRANAVTIFETLGVENVYVASRPQTWHIETRGGPIQVLTLPWLGRSILTSLDEHKNKSIEEIQQTLLEKVENVLLGEIAALDPTQPAVLLAHASVFGATFGSERRTILGRDLLLPASLYANPAFDYVALGHIHKHQVLNDAPLVVYSGSLERIDFGEENEDKGFVVAEVTKGRARYTFVQTPARKFITIRVQVTGQDPMSDIAKAIEQVDVRDAVVRLIVRACAEHEPLIDDRACRQLLRDAFYIAAIVRDIERFNRIKLGGADSVESLTPRQLLEQYLRSKNTSQERIHILLEYADRLMISGE